MRDTTDLRRRVYDAARTPAIRLSESTLKLAQAGGVFHLNGSEADEIIEAVIAIIEPVIAERDTLRENIAADCDRRAGYYDHPDIWLPDSQSPDAIAARAMQQAWATAARLIRSGEIPAELIQAASSDIGDEDGAQ